MTPPGTPAPERTPIPLTMWKELSELDERISTRIATALADHKNEIVRIGENHGLTEQELKDRGILIMTTLGTTAPGNAANRGQ